MIPLLRTSLIAFCAGWTGPSVTAQDAMDHDVTATLVAWKIAHFSPEELRDGTSDDARELGSDGIPNLLRYALGLSPRDPTEPPVMLERIDDQIVVHYPTGPAKSDVSCTLEFSPDLDDWRPVTETAAASTSHESPGSNRLQHMFPRAETLFFRLSAERLTVDSDDDKLHDDDELAWFATIAHGPADDPDQDGVTTADELSTGRSPHHGVISDQSLALRSTGLEVFTPLD